MKKSYIGKVFFKVKRLLSSKLRSLLVSSLSLVWCALTPGQLFAQSKDAEVPAQLMASLDSLTLELNKNRLNHITDSYTPFVMPDSLSIQARMNLMESEIPLVYNRHVEGFINLYGNKKRELTSRILTLSTHYFPLFEEVLYKEGLPLEFKYLAVVESALNPRALSWAGASGLWQFIHSTGKMYGLKINGLIDERRDPYQATLAACQYFKNSYALYGDWLLVIASYNCGPGNVNKAIRRSGGHKNFWKIMPYLPKETRGYVPAFIAVAYVMNHYSDFGIRPADAQQVSGLMESVEVVDQLHFSQVANACGVSEELLCQLNPGFKKNYIPEPAEGTPYRLTLPYEAAMRFIELKDSIYNSPLLAYDRNGMPYQYVFETRKITYVSPRYESIYQIAKKFDVEATDIKSWNIIRGTKVAKGKRLTLYVHEKVRLDGKGIPTSSILNEQELPAADTLKETTKVAVVQTEEPKKVVKPEVKPQPVLADIKYHKVAPGDTLYSISRLHGVSVEDIRKMNHLAANAVIKPGEKLIVSN